MDPITIRRIEIRKLNPDFNEFQQIVTYVVDADKSRVLTGVLNTAEAEELVSTLEEWATDSEYDLG